MRGDRWERRPWLARLVRIGVVVAPAVAGMLAGWAVTGALPEPSGFAAAWWVALVAAVVAAVIVSQRLARRFLPLAWLLHLTMAFPDRAPSRLATARRAASRKARTGALRRAGTGTLSAASGEAAQEALVLVAALSAHDRRTRGHSERVRVLADVLAEEAGVSPEDRDRLRWGALLHDIGKLTVPGEILNKPDQPDAAEWARLRRHPEEGDRLVAGLGPWLGEWAGAVGHHHERWDGTGYPNGLAGEGISRGGRILAVADAYEVMTATRAYKSPMRPDAARRELVHSAGSHFDPELVRHFLAIALPRLWWAVGASAVVALFPWLGKLLGAPIGERLRQAATAPAVAAAAVAALALAGVTAPEAHPEPARQETAASPQSPEQPAAPGPVGTPGEAPALAPRAASAAPGPTATPGCGGSRPCAGPDSRRAVPLGLLPLPMPPPGPAPEPGPGPEPGPDNEGGPDTEPAPEPDRPVPPPDTVGAGPPTPSPEPFRAGGTILAPSVMGVLGAEPVAPCRATGPVGTGQLVFELPAASRRPGAAVFASGSDPLGLHDLDVAFYGASCEPLGAITDATTDPSGVLPPGAAWVVVTERGGIATSVSVAVG